LLCIKLFIYTYSSTLSPKYDSMCYATKKTNVIIRSDIIISFSGSHHICQAEHKPSMSMAPHPINYQSAAPFHKAPQLDRLNLSSTRNMCPRCSTVTESSTICMYADDKQAYVDTPFSLRRSYSPCHTTKLYWYP